MNNMFEISYMGYNSKHPNGIYMDRPTGMDCNLFLHIKSACKLMVNNEMIDITEPCFVLYKSFMPHKYYSVDSSYTDDWIHFYFDDMDGFFLGLGIPYNTPMYIINSMEIFNMFVDLNSEYLQNGPHHKEIIDMKLRTLFYKFSDIYHLERSFPNKLNRFRLSFNDIRNDIYNFSNFNKKTTVSDIAAEANLSVSYFQHIYKKLFGVSVMQDIIKSRITYACYLLQNNYDSIADIAGQCGYENKEHFTRQFKLETGYTPKEYRELHSN